MIESIIAVCPSREERQQWIEYLTQEQHHASMTKSPTSTTTSHVSYPSLPYVRLSKYFAKLVRRKVIYTELLKKLLYFQYIFKPDLSQVKMRKCTVTYTIYPSRYDSCSDDGSTDSNSVAIRHQTRHKSSLKLDVTYKLWENDESQSSLGNEFNDGATESTSSFICHDLRLPEVPRLETSRSVPNAVLKCSTSHSESSRSAIHARGESPPNTIPRRNCRDENCDCLNSKMKNWKRTELFHRNREEDTINFCLETGVDEAAASGEADSQLLQFHSTTPRSSDSGMADSYHLNSSELNSSYRHSRNKGETDAARCSHSESENDENKFEHQCICSSPFGSTPRDSLRDASTYGKINTEESSTALESIRAIGQLEIEKNPTHVTSELVIRGKHLSEPLPRRDENIVKKIHRRGNIDRQFRAEKNVPEQEKIYTSGLYAHWWLKKKIPISGNAEQGKLPWHGCLLS